jgi:hypothetical protein
MESQEAQSRYSFTDDSEQEVITIEKKVFAVEKRVEEGTYNPDFDGVQLRWFHKAVAVFLGLLFMSFFVSMLTSGLVFSDKVEHGDCLSQSWVMFSVGASLCLFFFFFLQLPTSPKIPCLNLHRPILESTNDMQAIAGVCMHRCSLLLNEKLAMRINSLTMNSQHSL